MDKIILLNSNLYKEDLAKIVDSLEWINFNSKKTILVTGANGLICSSIVDIFLELNKKLACSFTVIVAVRNIEKAKIRFEPYLHDKNFSYIQYDALLPLNFPSHIDYIIHGAGNAYPSLYVKEPVETLLANIKGLENILTYAKRNSTRVLYISSSEVYGQLQKLEPIQEMEYGYVDLLNPRSSYPTGKRAAETLCISYNNEYNVDSVIVRPGHIYGPTASQQDNRVSSTFMYNAAKGENIILRSEGRQLRSYCYCLDCASAIITVLFNGKTGEAYNISNMNSICSIREMAEIYANSGNVKCKFDIPKNEEKKSFNPMLNSSLNSKKLESLGWKPVFTKEEGFEHSVKICKEIL